MFFRNQISIISLLFLILFGSYLEAVASSPRDTIHLDGIWNYRLIAAPAEIAGEGFLSLPSTLDNAHKSIYNPESSNSSRLRREFSFVGQAIYSRGIFIPDNWANKDIRLWIERSKPSLLKIDGDTISFSSRISSPQYYNLAEILTPGKHTIEITVNNADSIPPMVASSSNAVSENSQTNWNGILGDIFIESRPFFHIKSFKIDDNTSIDSVSVIVEFSSRAPSGLILKTEIEGKNTIVKKIKARSSELQFSFPLDKTERWEAQNPLLFNINCSIVTRNGKVLDDVSLTTGFRTLSFDGKDLSINNHPLFLRGTVNAAVFPSTAHAPMYIESWMQYFSILKDYGLNHVRFHSWTPPEAAFIAADRLGFYLLVELPLWGELDHDLVFHNRFLKEDLKGIMEAYAIHPSFIMFSNGNELWGDISLMGEYMKEAKKLNPRILATYGSNLYLGMNGEIGGEDFLLSSKTSDNPSSAIRGSLSFADSPTGGYFNSNIPNSAFNFAEALSEINVPVISHEVGQYQSYPDFSEIDKYEGILKPDNLKEFRKMALEAGTLPKAQRFHENSGKWAAKLYKAEIEAALRTPGMAGFQLLGIQDYPGQGTALVGILNPFMEPKDFISPQDWNQASSDLVLLAEFPKFTFESEECVQIPVLTANYTNNPDSVSEITWKTDFDAGILDFIPKPGLFNAGVINLRIPKLSSPQKFSLSLIADNPSIVNEYEFWVYPKNPPEVKSVKTTSSVKEALDWLEKGDKVLLCPDSAAISATSLAPLFVPDFWNYRMFRTICDEMKMTPSPGTLGLSIDTGHPALNKFPTDSHTDWQWFSIIMNSRPLIIDRLPNDFQPIVEVIDNIERNERLAILLECKVGKGKLMIFPGQLNKILDSVEGKWFIFSLKSYMAGKEFNPRITLSPEQVVNLLTKPSNTRLIKQLRNPTYSPPSE